MKTIRIFFHGLVLRIQEQHDTTMRVTAFDFGYFMKKQLCDLLFRGNSGTPLQKRVSHAVCVPIWSLAAPMVPIDGGVQSSLIFKIVDTAYTISAEKKK